MYSKKRKIFGNLLTLLIIIAILVVGYTIYSKYNYNDYMKAEYIRGNSTFERDSNIKYSDMNSYKIENKDFNDSMFYKEIEVYPNTVYKVSCMIKTKDVENEKQNADTGAHICINKTLEKSVNVTGTTDWKKVDFIFNSKNNTKLEIGFRLGGYSGNSKGTAWFSDFEIESGVADTSNTWNYLCLLFNNVNVNIPTVDGNQHVQLHLTKQDKEDMRLCIQRFKDALPELSNGKIKANCEVFEVDDEIRTMSFDDENGFYVSPIDVQKTIDKYIDEGKYDHIFIAFRTGDINSQSEIPVNDWIGLGGMAYRGIGFSNIRLPNESNNYVYKYDTRVNTFPEEVYIHEFLHTLERNAEEYGYERPELHSYGKYGYKEERLLGLKKWYADYMNCTIKSPEGNIGLNAEIFTKKPAKITDFEISNKLNVLKEPENIIEEIKCFIDRAVQLFSGNE